MKRIIFIIIVSCISLIILVSSVGQNKLPNKIAWHEGKKLSWSNFKGVLANSSTRTAISNLYTSYDVEIKDSILYLNTACYFDELASRKKDYLKNHKNDFLLIHEEIHFDIGELFARKLRANIAECKFSSIYNIQAEMGSIMKDIKAKRIAFHKLYDEETNHSKIEKGQLIWNKKVPLMLDSLKLYSDPIIKVDLRKIVTRNERKNN